MNTLFVGKNLLELSEVDSTNTFANRLLSSQPTEGTVIKAAYQSQGRGQQTNTWLSDASANLTFSLILYPRFLSPNRVFSLNKVVSLAIYGCLKEFLPEQQILIKWPNDILVGNRKVAGILIENHLDQHGVKASIIGIGLNVNQIKFPSELNQKATSIAQEAGKQFDLDLIFSNLMERLEGLFLQMRGGKTERIDFEYLQALYGYGEQIRVRIPDPKVLTSEADGKNQSETISQYNNELPPLEKEVVLVGVSPEGLLALEMEKRLHYFYHKQIEFIL